LEQYTIIEEGVCLMIDQRIAKWIDIARKWGGHPDIQIDPALILAVIQQESGGNPEARRFEPAYCERYIDTDPKWQRRMAYNRWAREDVASSYGLMQPMFPTAWGYGCRDPRTLLDPDQNVRFGAAILSSLVRKYSNGKKFHQIEDAELRGVLRLALAAYNGGSGGAIAVQKGEKTRAVRYADNVLSIWDRLRKEPLS